MHLVCPTCHRPALKITRSLELPPDAVWDERTLQTLLCSACDNHFLGLYQESRRGALDSESVHHLAYLISKADYKRLLAWLRRCPRPRDSHCDCPAHTSLQDDPIAAVQAESLHLAMPQPIPTI